MTTNQKRLVVTAVTKNYLGYARTLARSIEAHNPGLRLLVAMVDRIDGAFDPKSEPFDVVTLDALSGQESLRAMSFYYTAFEMSNALKAFAHRYVLEHRPDVDAWLYIDSDVMVTGSLDAVFADLDRCSILLAPHTHTPVAIEHVNPHEIGFCGTGLYNGGFLGLRRTEQTKSFVDWFVARMPHYAFADVAAQFVDQLWLNLVPLYFSESRLCELKGLNLGHWNLHERTLSEGRDGAPFADGEPLLSVHFSGWKIDRPEEVSHHAPMYAGKRDPVWGALGRRYRDALLGNGHETVKQWPYSFAKFASGEPITHPLRRLFHELLVAGKWTYGDPFAARNTLRWLHTERRVRAKIPSWLKRLARR
jgi:hypothetical protein